MTHNNVSPSHENAAFDNYGEAPTASETTTATTKTVTTATSSKPKSPNVENGHITSAPAIGPGADPGSGAAVQKKNCEWLEVQVMGLANEG